MASPTRYTMKLQIHALPVSTQREPPMRALLAAALVAWHASGLKRYTDLS